MPSSVDCEVGDFYQNVMAMFEANVDELEADLQEDVYGAADDAAAHIKADVGTWSQTEDLPGERERLTYERGWTAYKYAEHDGHVEAVVANRTAPGLTHLIEKGHELFVNGHDTGRRTRARPHISDAYEYAVKRHFAGGDA